jgi:hypothetical protein
MLELRTSMERGAGAVSYTTMRDRLLSRPNILDAYQRDKYMRTKKKRLQAALGLAYLWGVEVRRGKLSKIERKEVLMAFDCGYEARGTAPIWHNIPEAEKAKTK